jgi:hypothetical protein
MLDTVRIKTNRLFHPDITDCLPDNWKSTDILSKSVNEDGGKWASNKVRLEEKTTSLRIGGTRFAAEWIEASLPKLLHGHNGMLIDNQRELDDALNKLYKLVDEVCDPADDAADDTFIRVDLAWQFKGDPEAFKAAHRNCHHRRIRKDAGEYDGQGIYWKGTQLRVRFYDKCLSQLKRPGDVVRVEVQLRGNTLRKAFTGSEHGDLRTLSFWRCYEVFREFVCGFCPAPIPRVPNLAHLLTLGEVEEWKTKAGVSQFDIWKIGVSPRHVSRMRRDMASLRPKVHHIDWETLLPVHELPPLVEL